MSTSTARYVTDSQSDQSEENIQKYTRNKREAQEDMTASSKPKKKPTKNPDADDADCVFELTIKKPKQWSQTWSKMDELILLEGMIEFNIKSTDSNNVDRLLDYMKTHSDSTACVKKSELIDKIKGLKQKYVKNLGKGLKASLTDEHEIKLFDKSSKIWVLASTCAATIKEKIPKLGVCPRCSTEMEDEESPEFALWCSYTHPQLYSNLRHSEIADMAALYSRVFLAQVEAEGELEQLRGGRT
ncbi:hypothetical protein JCGZ_10783 [Jatropha curcas]|uniref:Glabrous enhancer-binding protein-like DBD domain-containing protein n=1 Tax=Jatropha curcas TaxID=180498 RepID=A0A067LF00_JATCU|nr:hypothetical protein JCGZ_10783 [Jatropha curcas]